MKNFFALVSIWSILLLSPMAHADLFDSVTSAGQNKTHPEHSYLVETKGYDPRIYEFVPKLNAKYFCVMIVVDGKAPALQCMPKQYQ